MSADERAELRSVLPEVIERAAQSIALARDTANEVVGSLGHLAFARAELNALLERALGRIGRRKRQ